MIKKLLKKVFPDSFERSVRSRKWHLRRCWCIIRESLPTFTEAEGQLRASSLTYYTLFAFAPVLALIFGMAKGFSLDIWVKTVLISKMKHQEEMLNWLFGFAESALSQASGGVIAGVGALILCWSVIKMIGNIETAVNRVWHVKKSRTIFRKFTDYLSFLVIAPVLLIAASSATLLLERGVNFLAENWLFFRGIKPLLEVLFRLLPFLIVWILFTFVYAFLPNTRVKFSAALFGGIIAGTIYQLLQAGYFFMQIALSKYNVIYGSFSALPLFLVWSYCNWTVILFGVTLSYLYQTYDYDSKLAKDSERTTSEKRLIAVMLAAIITRDFADGEPAPNSRSLAKRTGLTETLVCDILNNLDQRNIIAPIAASEYGTITYIPAMPLEKMTVFNLFERYDDFKLPAIPDFAGSELCKDTIAALKDIRQSLTDSPGNMELLQLLPAPLEEPEKKN
ncbi:MAG: YihY/virulence factor BrkB family protein [Lentisphaerae bacterium]|nr:YihY/virulence factor BrkB family protein [Lentisphaerota bacterium]